MVKKQVSKNLRTRLKIVSATITAIFSLAATFVATYAWFSSSSGANVSGMSVSVMTLSGAELNSIKLTKFDYGWDSLLRSYDYLNPTKGKVSVSDYVYNETENAFGAFVEVGENNGDYTYDSETKEYTKVEENAGSYKWVTYLMNIYDPVEKLIRGGDLINLNCNVIYEATFSTVPNSKLDLIANRYDDAEHIPNRENNEVILSEYADFDVYFESDLAIIDTYSDSATYRSDDYVYVETLDAEENTIRTYYQCVSSISVGETFNPDHWIVIPAAAYSGRSSYQLGDYVINGGNLYQCKVASIAAPEEEEDPNTFTASEWRLVCASVPSYSSSSTYHTCDYVIQDHNLYRCLTAINSGESFTASKWQLVDGFSRFSSYKAGDAAIYSGKVYQCTRRVTSGNDFDSSKWQKINSYSTAISYSSGNLSIQDGCLYKYNGTKWETVLCNKIYYPSYNLEFDYSGSGTPDNGVGSNDDTYLDISTNEVYFKSNNAWELVRDIDDEDVYYKISYLSSLEDSHYHFYAANYSTDKVYNTGDFVVYTGDSKLYSCSEAIDNPEEFDETKWSEIEGVPTYSDSSSYESGDYVIKDGVYYKCIQNATSSDSFDSTHWTTVNKYSNDAKYAADDVIYFNEFIYKCKENNVSGLWNSTKWVKSETDSEVYLTHEKVVPFEGGEETIYVNVNYAPSQADVFSDSLYDTRKTIFDFYFDFQFSAPGGN